MIPTADPGTILRESKPFVDYLEKQTIYALVMACDWIGGTDSRRSVTI
jgi:hypothetical protein